MKNKFNKNKLKSKSLIQTIIKANNNFNLKTIKNNLWEKYLDINPKEIILYNTVKMQIYEIPIKIINKYNRMIKIIINPPENINFKINCKNIINLSPGICFNLILKYICNKETFIEDLIKIEDLNKNKIDISINIFPKLLKLEFPSYIDFGFINLNQIVEKKIKIKNLGQKNGNIKILIPDKCKELNVNPNEFILKQNEIMEININFKSSNTGIFQSKLKLLIDNEKIDNYIEITATIIDHLVFIVNEKGEEFKEINFENILYGNEEKKEFFVINNSPSIVNINLKSINLKINDKINEIQTPNEYGEEKLQKVLKIIPTDGKIQPYSHFRIELKIKLNPNDEIFQNFNKYCFTQNKKDILFSNQNYSIKFELDKKDIEILSKIRFKIPEINITQKKFNFNQITIGNKTNINFKIISIENINNIKLNFKKVSQFIIKEEFLILKPKETREINLYFKPNNIGEFNINVPLIINDCFKIYLECYGKGIYLYKLNSIINNNNNKKFKSKNISNLNKSLNYKKFNKKNINNSINIKEGLFIPESIPIIENKVNGLFVTRNIKNYNVNDFNKINYKPDYNIPGRILSSQINTLSKKREIRYELNFNQLKNIYSGPKELNFGKIFLKSEKELFFKIKNEMEFSIIAKLKINKIELQNSYLKSQIISSGQEGSFSIIFRGEKLGDFNEIIEYSINNNHFFKINIKASVISPQLKFNKSNIDFKFNDEKIGLFCEENLKFSNKGNAIINYNIKLNGKNFFVNKKKGHIKPNESKILKIFYKPVDLKSSHDEMLFFNLDNNNKPHVIKLNGNVNESNGSLNVDFIDFGQISISQKLSKYFFIKNNVKHNLIFEINPEEIPENVFITPLSGIIYNDSNEKIEINIQNNNLKTYSREEINIYLRGGNILKLYFSAIIVIPKIQINPEIWNCGEIFLGNILKKEIKLINISSIPAIVNLNLKEKNCNFIQIIQKNEEDSICIAEKDLENTENNNTYKNLSIDESEENKNFEDNDQNDLKVYDIILKPKKELDIIIIFTPEKPIYYNIDLPFNLVGYNGIENCKLKILCNCLSPQFIMKPINGIIDFGRITLTNFNNQNTNFTKIEYLEITNPDNNNDLEFSIKNIDPISGVFSIDPLNDIIPSNDFIKIKIQFSLNYIIKINEKYKLIFKQASKVIENELVLKGQTISPRILFDRKEVILSPVPLNIISQQTLKIFNDGYSNNVFSYKWQGNYENLINVKINGKEFRLGGNKNSINVDILFKSNRPISISSFLNISDETGKIYSILVSATSDNCIFSLYSFIMMKDINYIRKSNGDIIVKEEINNSIELDENKSYKGSIKSNSSYYNFSFINNPKKIFKQYIKLSNFIKLWLNKNLLNENISRFPEDLIQGNGNIIYIILNTLTNNKDIFKTKVKLNGDEPVNERIEKLIQQYTNLIQNLKEIGALLNTIRPEYLLNYQDYLTYSKKQFNDNSNFIHKISESVFNFYSYDSWFFLIFQILKLFYLSRIDITSLKKILPNSITEIKIPSSNIFSYNELILFTWIELIFKETFNYSDIYYNHIINPHEDFINKNYLYALGYFYLPFLTKEEFNDLTYEESVQYLEEFDLEFPEKPEDLNNIVIVLNLINMFLTLPLYKPKESILFETNLNEPITNHIWIKNPTNKVIYYNVKIENEKNFIDYYSDIEFIKIDGNQEYEYPITFSGRLSIPIIGRIIFKTKKENTNNAIPLVFDLKSTIKNKIPNNTYALKNSNLYEFNLYEINIVNPFEIDDEFDILIEENFLEIPSFFLKENKIKLYKNINNILRFYFLGFELKEYKANIIIQNYNLGEYIYEVIIKTEILEDDKINISQSLDNPLNNINIPIQNENFKLIESLKNIEEYINKNNIINKKFKEKFNNILNGNKTKNFYNVIINPKNIINYNDNIFKINEKTKSTELKLNVNYNNPIYNQNIYIYLINNNSWDVRSYLINLSLYPKTLKIVLEMEVNQRKSISQSIPIYNSLDKDVLYNIEVIHENIEKNFFDYTNNFWINKSSKADFKIIFKPLYGEKDKLNIILINPYTKEKYDILILGTILYPFCEDEIKLECKSGEITKKFLDFRPLNINEFYSVHFNNELFRGKKEITFQKKNNQYELEIFSNIPGKFLEKISFISPKNEIYWFCFELNIIGDFKKYKKNIISMIRKKLITKIPIINNSKKKCIVYTNIKGDYLKGEKKFVLEPESTYYYELEFLPLNLIKEKGFLIFKSSIIGEIFYELALESKLPNFIKLPLVKAELGKNYIFKLEIENNYSKTEEFSISNSNESNFLLKSKTLKIESNKKGIIYIEFIPIDVGITEISDIVVESENQYPFNFQLTGIGEPPNEFDFEEITGEWFKETNSKIIFKNPFNKEININLFITDENDQIYEGNDFKFLNLNEILKISPRQNLEYCFIFYPKEISKYTIKIHFKYNDRLTWIFPIIAISYFKHEKIFKKISVKSNYKIEEVILLPLLSSYNIKDINDFNYSFNSKIKIIKKWIQIKKLELIEIDDNLFIKILLKFHPLKPINNLIDFKVNLIKSNGMIIFPLSFISELPDIYKTINLSATPQKFCKIKLPFNSPYLRNSIDFKAYLTPDSSPEFFISPTSGKLEPEMRNGSFFIIEYKPLNFGCKRKAELRIETFENLWRFKLYGDWPKYIPPKA